MKFNDGRTVGDNIKNIRESIRNYKRSYVAEKLNLTTRAYANIENNVSEITLDRLEKIAHILNCRPADILTYKRSDSPYHSSIDKVRELTNQIKLLEDLIESKNTHILLLENLIKKYDAKILTNE